MRRQQGFTLVELLVVIAIIAILAAIVVPRVTDFIGRANMAKAISEISSIELSITKILTDTGRRDLSQVVRWDLGFAPSNNPRLDKAYYETVANQVSRDMYDLLRRGRESAVAQRTVQDQNGETKFLIDPSVRAKLGATYLDIPRDPWDQLYQFWPGPWRVRVQNAQTPQDASVPIPFRSWRLNPFVDPDVDPTDPEYVAFVYADGDGTNPGTRDLMEQERPGNPDADDMEGFPAPTEEPFYIWSNGENTESDQLWMVSEQSPDRVGGGDDINSWDTDSGWEAFY